MTLPDEYGDLAPALRLFCALLLAVTVAALLASCGPAVVLRRLPPPLTGDLSCSDPGAQYLTREGVCRELRRGRGPVRRVAVPAPGGPL